MPKTCTKLKYQWKPQSLLIRGDHWLTSPPTPSHNSRLQNQHLQPHSPANAWSPGMRGRTVGQWTPAKDLGSLRPSVAQRRARRGCAGCELRPGCYQPMVGLATYAPYHHMVWKRRLPGCYQPTVRLTTPHLTLVWKRKLPAITCC